MATRWTASVTPANAHREYPRPQLVRKGWTNLNGLWDYATTPAEDKPDASVFTRKILVPFPPESMLSRIHESVPEGHTIWYRRKFETPKNWHLGERVLLHFGASDWRTKVYVNGTEVGTHQGGYDAFTIDVTDALLVSGSQEVLVAVQDPSDSFVQPRGKQVRKPGGIFYTSTSGIWQTVWLEAVPATYISGLKLTPTNDGSLSVEIHANHPTNVITKVEVLDGKKTLASAEGHGDLIVHVPRPKLWSPESPTLYKLKVSLGRDEVESYTAFREVGLVKDSRGHTRLGLNGKPYFMVGPLDQGFWPDGIYTAPNEEAMIYDLEVTKKLGFNMIRKHVKVEPATWYAACDRLGILVWQDMPSGDKFISPSDPDIDRTPESAGIYERELKAMMEGLYNHPSVVTWVLFNEGWGQFDTARITLLARTLDPTRLINSVTGWADRGVGDMMDRHDYPGPSSPDPETHRAAVLGEFGGLGLVTPGHMWKNEGWGYQSFKNADELTVRFEGIFEQLHSLIAQPGLSAAVYTQTTDVETESNGLMTYDRAVIKMDVNRVHEAVRSLFLPPPHYDVVLPTSEKAPQTYRFSLTAPPSGWEKPDFSDATWASGPGGFGTAETQGLVLGTTWDTKDIWLRRAFTIDTALPTNVYLRLLHDDDVEVYLDGNLIHKQAGSIGNYGNYALPGGLTAGKHVLAIHCHQFEGGQSIDAGFVHKVPGHR
jgi:hypothetical protein